MGPWLLINALYLLHKGDCRRESRCKFLHVPNRALKSDNRKGGNGNDGGAGDGDDDDDDMDTAERLLKRHRSLQHQQHMEFRFNGNERKDNDNLCVKNSVRENFKVSVKNTAKSQKFLTYPKYRFFTTVYISYIHLDSILRCG